MLRYWPVRKFSFVVGVVRYSDLAYVSLVEDTLVKKRRSHSFIREWDAGVWRGGDDMNVGWDTVDAVLATKPLEQGLILGERGEIMCIGSGDFHFEQIGSGKASPKERGPMRGAGRVGDCVYAVGMQRQVYRRDIYGNWKCIDRTIPKTNEDIITGFESIDGFNEKEIYAVGWDGEIWQYDGNVWTQRDSPVNVILNDVCCGGDGKVYACGLVGMVVQGRADLWEVINHETISDDIWSLAWFRDQLYMSTVDAVFRLEDKELKVVKMPADGEGTSFHLSVHDGVLWSIGAKDILAFDGIKWTRID